MVAAGRVQRLVVVHREHHRHLRGAARRSGGWWERVQRPRARHAALAPGRAHATVCCLAGPTRMQGLAGPCASSTHTVAVSRNAVSDCACQPGDSVLPPLRPAAAPGARPGAERQRLKLSPRRGAAAPNTPPLSHVHARASAARPGQRACVCSRRRATTRTSASTASGGLASSCRPTAATSASVPPAATTWRGAGRGEKTGVDAYGCMKHRCGCMPPRPSPHGCTLTSRPRPCGLISGPRFRARRGGWRRVMQSSEVTRRSPGPPCQHGNQRRAAESGVCSCVPHIDQLNMHRCRTARPGQPGALMSW